MRCDVDGCRELAKTGVILCETHIATALAVQKTEQSSKKKPAFQALRCQRLGIGKTKGQCESARVYGFIFCTSHLADVTQEYPEALSQFRCLEVSDLERSVASRKKKTTRQLHMLREVARVTQEVQRQSRAASKLDFDGIIKNVIQGTLGRMDDRTSCTSRSSRD